MMEVDIMREAEGVMGAEGSMIRMRVTRQRHDYDENTVVVALSSDYKKLRCIVLWSPVYIKTNKRDFMLVVEFVLRRHAVAIIEYMSKD